MINFLQNLPPHENKITWSTVLTVLRMVLVPCIIAALIKERWGIACTLFCIAAATDSVDGALARWRNEQTQLGALLDPIADKLLLLSSFFTLAVIDSPLFNIPWWFVVVVAVREIIIISGALICYNRTKEWRISPTRLGKMTTAAQVVFIMWLFLCYFLRWVPLKTYNAMLLLIVSVELISLGQYMIIGLRWLRSSLKDSI